MYWYWVNVYNNESFIGSIYTSTSNKGEVEKTIDEKYGVGKWTRYSIE